MNRAGRGPGDSPAEPESLATAVWPGRRFARMNESSCAETRQDGTKYGCELIGHTKSFLRKKSKCESIGGLFQRNQTLSTSIILVSTRFSSLHYPVSFVNTSGGNQAGRLINDQARFFHQDRPEARRDQQGHKGCRSGSHGRWHDALHERLWPGSLWRRNDALLSGCCGHGVLCVQDARPGPLI